MTTQLAQQEAIKMFNTFKSFQPEKGLAYGARYAAKESSLFLIQTWLDKKVIKQDEYKELKEQILIL